MNQFEHNATRREKVEEEKKIVIGMGVIVYDATAEAWALPGGLHTESAEAAVRQAQHIDAIISGKTKNHDVTRKGYRT